MDKTKLSIDTYNACAETYLQKYSDFHLYDDAYDSFIEYIKPGARVLDLGCGPGVISKYICERIDVSPVLVDLSEKMIELAKEIHPGAETFVCDIRKLPFEKESHDYILAAFCLPFLYDDEAKCFIKDIAGILRKGGYIYLSTMKGKGSEITDTSFSNGKEMFLNYYSEEFLEKEFESNGLRIEKNITKNYPERDGSFTVDLIYILKKA